ncbi:uncharacterized protein LOC135349156 isoform X2 [Halichondria panicea]|uniref:uncharacterized protein LOC135349156 isoform X2 n=1 Tax=Halichondria panicea TaxID=6063 RepID=UPI00312B8E7D
MASPEYQAITECRDLLVSTISQDPQGIADMMVKKFLISENLRDELGLQTLTKRAKARLVVDAMSDLVKQNSGHFDILVSIFTSVGLWTGDLVTLLKKARRKCSGGSEFPALTLTVLTRELFTVTEPHLLGVGLGIEQHILETIVKNNKFDIEGQKMALFSYIANNHKRLNITWDDIASVLRDMLNKGNLALDIEKKIKSSRRDSLEDFPCFASPDTYDKMMEAALVPDPDQADQLPPAPNETDGRVGAVLHPPQNEETETLGASPEEHPSKNQHAKRCSREN